MSRIAPAPVRRLVSYDATAALFTAEDFRNGELVACSPRQSLTASFRLDN